MSGPIEGDLEAFIDGKVEFPPLSVEDRKKISGELGALVAADALGNSQVPLPESVHRPSRHVA